MASLDWFERASCKEGNITYVFFTESLEDTAKAICAGCTVKAECLAYALATHQDNGVWGGLNELERTRKQREVTPGGTAPIDVTYTTNARSTGATCSAGRSPAGWSVVCRPHGAVAIAANRTIAEFAVSRPEEWCYDCRLIAAGKMPKLRAS